MSSKSNTSKSKRPSFISSVIPLMFRLIELIVKLPIIAAVGFVYTVLRLIRNPNDTKDIINGSLNAAYRANNLMSRNAKKEIKSMLIKKKTVKKKECPMDKSNRW